MKLPKQVSLKHLAIIVVSTILLTSFMFYVFAATPSSTFVIESGIYPGAPSYTVWREGSSYFAKNAHGEIKYSGTNATTVVQNAINGLTGGRTWKETVLLKGEITLSERNGGDNVNGVLVLPSYTILEIDGLLKLGNGVNMDMIENSNHATGNSHIEIVGGLLDGNKANNDATPEAHFGIDIRNSTQVIIRDITVQNVVGGHGINFQGGETNIFSNILTQDNGFYGLYLDQSCNNNTISNVIAKNNNGTGGIVIGRSSWNTITNCQAIGNAGQGFTIDTYSHYNTVVSSIAANNTGSGFQVTEGSMGTVLSSLTSVNNGAQGIAVTKQTGVTVNSTVISAVFCANNVLSGMHIVNSSYTIVSNSIFKDNNSYGIYESGTQSDYNIFVSNIATENTNLNITIVGTNTKVNLCYNGTTWIS